MQDDEIDLWAVDEVHFQQQGSRCRMWIPPEDKDPIVFHHPTRKSVGYFGAVRLRDGEFFFHRETGRFNGETFWSFLQAFRQASMHSGHRVVAISDNACYHRARIHAEWRQTAAVSIRAGFPVTVQSRTQSHRTRTETGPAALPTQPLFRIPGKRDRSCRDTVRQVDAAQRNPPPVMRNYLRRYVQRRKRQQARSPT